jgi:glucose/arabinose dehydrogenase
VVGADCGPALVCDEEAGECASACPALRPGYERTRVIEGLPEIQVVDMDFDPSGRGFIALKSGAIRLWDGAALQEEPFVVVPDTSNAWIENGILGVAVDPDFAASPYVYVFQSYSTEPGVEGTGGDCTALDCPFALEAAPDGTTTIVNAPGKKPVFGNTRQRVVRYLASGKTAAPGSFEVLVDGLPGGTQTHNGGGLAFGTDGTLFVGLGDSTTPPNAQDFSNVAGCVLRIDKATGQAPPDNPFVAEGDGIPDAIWACGVRQGFGLAVSAANGGLYQSENGPAYGDEVNYIPKGANMGWNLGAGRLDTPGLTDPIATWTTTISPVKMVVYNGSLMPELYGDPLVASWKDGDLRRLHLPDPVGAPGAVAWEGDLVPYTGKPTMVAQDHAGYVYYGEHLQGEVWRVGPVSACEAPQAVVSLDVASGDAPLAVVLDGSASAWQGPATKIKKWYWELGANGGSHEGPVLEHTFTKVGTHTGMLTVVDDEGRWGQTTFTVVVESPSGDMPPEAFVAMAVPAEGVAPVEVTLRGHAQDAEGGAVELTWDFGDETPPFVVASQPAGEDVEVKHTFTEPGLFTVTLTAKDALGQTGAAVVKISVE